MVVVARGNTGVVGFIQVGFEVVAIGINNILPWWVWA
jgi:hypothetical protein